MSFSLPSTLFELPLSFSKTELKAIILFIEDVWDSNYSRKMGKLSTDLDIMKAYFNPISTGSKLRDKISYVEEITTIVPDFSIKGISILVEDSKYILRPEGRIIYEFLKSEQKSDFIVISAKIQLATLSMAYNLYKDWGSQRIMDVISILSGRESLQLQPIALLLWLLVNRCTEESRALRKSHLSDDYQKVIDESILACIVSFVSALSDLNDNKSDLKQFNIYSAWQLTEISRRLGNQRLINNTKYTYLDNKHLDAIIKIIAMDLSKRSKLSIDTLNFALENMYATFVNFSTQLASFNFYHEQPSATRKLFTFLINEFRKQREK